MHRQSNSGAPSEAARRCVEIRSYTLQPGARASFGKTMSDEAVPMLRRWGVDVVAFGSSAHDEDSYYLIRAYRDLADRQRSQDEFYASAEWREGPRERILAPIVNYTSVVVPMSAETIDALRG
ncbi:MAG: NIPSNAP family protein [Steroidobacter sp.]